ncbi:kinase-like protein [Auriculariales sp. MPI-PUGE-AT-0066]|nr:kinase-like protein [Auriculariales sp. MPI-PUGE-AT-0066]
MEDSSSTSAAANPLDLYEPLEVIGTGSFGTIRKVRRQSDGVILARKELNFERMSERDRKQIVAEVNILKELNHEHIVRYHDRFVDRDNGILYIVMEYCGGGDLAAIITRCRRAGTMLPEDTIWNYFLQIVLALHQCHHPGVPVHTGTMPPPPNQLSQQERRPAVLHRDLKPENVFLNGAGLVKLGDFGLSRQLASATLASTYVGTPYYMSPEVMQEKAYDGKSDIWSLGCLIYELCALNPPFYQAHTHAELAQFIRKGQIPALPRAYSASLSQVVKAMLNVNPAMRPSAQQLLQHERLDLTFKTARLETWAKDLNRRRTAIQQKEAELEQRDTARLAEFRTFLAQKETEVRAAMDVRENELREAMIRRERELCEGVLTREEELRQRWEEREEEIRVAWEQREADLLAEVVAREETLKQRETELDEREKQLEERNPPPKKAFKDVKNLNLLNRLHLTHEKSSTVLAASAISVMVPPKTPISRFISKSAVEGLSQAAPTISGEPGSAMKGVVMTETGEQLPTPSGAAGRNLANLLRASPVRAIQLDFSQFEKKRDGTSHQAAAHVDHDSDEDQGDEQHEHEDDHHDSPCPPVRVRQISVGPRSSLPVPVSTAATSSQEKAATLGRRVATASAPKLEKRATMTNVTAPASSVHKPERRATLASAVPTATVEKERTATTTAAAAAAAPIYDFNDEENLPSPFIKRNFPQATRVAPARPRPISGVAAMGKTGSTRAGITRVPRTAASTEEFKKATA